MIAPRIHQASTAMQAALMICVCCGIASVFATSPAIAGGSFAANWTVEPPATPVGAEHVALEAVSCAEATACMAVGYSEESTPGAIPLAETWNGSRWSLSGAVIASPGSSLLGVSCPVAGWCAAVGSDGQRGFAETWDGTAWTTYTIAVPPESQSFTLKGVSCSSPNHCLTAGYYVDNTGGYAKALVEEWNGSSWTEGNAVDPNPRGAPYDANSELHAISCMSATSCVAVGEYEDEPDHTHPALTESWNGSTWTVDTTPPITNEYQVYLNSISCWVQDGCIAVGGYSTQGLASGGTVSERWDGSAWYLQSAPTLPQTFSELRGVSCTSATFCAGLGYGSPGANYIALWNGAWSYEPFGTGLDSVSCVSEIYCVAVGGEETAVYVSTAENPPSSGSGGSSSPTPPTTPPPRPPSLPTSNPCLTTHGTIAHDLLASIKCTLVLTKLEAECGVGIVKLLYLPAKYLRLVEGAKTLAILDRLPAKTRPIARFFYDLFHAHYSKHAPRGFRTGAEAVITIKRLLKAYQLVLKIPDIHKAISRHDFSQLALDLDEILELRPCVQAVADGLAN